MGGNEIDLTSEPDAVSRRDAAVLERRTLAAAFAEMALGGDRVAFDVAGHRFTGHVTATGPDLVSMQTVGGRIDLHLCPTVPLQAEIVERGAGNRVPAKVDAETFRDRLVAQETEGSDVSVGSTFAEEPFYGSLVVGDDYAAVVSRMGAEHLLTLASIAYVTQLQV